MINLPGMLARRWFAVLFMASLSVNFATVAHGESHQPATPTLTHHGSVSAIPQFTTLEPLLAQASEENKPILLFFSQVDCPYCEDLKRDIIKPLLINEGESRLLVREIYQDYHQVLPEDNIVRQLKTGLHINFYPTIAFVDAEGNQVADPILGYQPSNDFYGYYLEEAIETAIEAVKRP